MECVKKGKAAKSVYLKKENIEYIEEKAKQTNNDFSSVLNQTIEMRRRNEEFDSCQNEF